MRGKLVDIVVWVVGLRITPADAGKTRIQILRGGQYQDHPRGCGENECPLLKSRGQLGSPPRMRGKHTDRR